jgi:hypothetical protein
MIPPSFVRLRGFIFFVKFGAWRLGVAREVRN